MEKATNKTIERIEDHAPSGTTEIVRQLRNIVTTGENRPRSSKEDVMSAPINSELPVVVTRRASGKTTGLVYFIGERTLLLSESDTIGVLCPNEGVAREFLYRFKYHFPTLKEPVVLTIDRGMSMMVGRKFHEVYAEEVFMMYTDYRLSTHLSEVCAHFPVVAGVGTIEAPTTILLKV